MRERSLLRPHSVVWTRGDGCAQLAHLLSDVEPARVTGDLAEQCIQRRADLLVAKKLPGGFDLLNVAVPIDFDPESTKSIVATVSGGPHSALAAGVAARLGSALGVPTRMVSAYRDEEDRADATALMERLTGVVPAIGADLVRADDLRSMVAGLDEGTLLVLGAPGGSWLQRVLLGPGARLRSKAPAGAVVVRHAPDRVYQWMGEPVFVAPLRQADDTLRIHPQSTLAVADQGVLVGLVRRAALEAAGAAVVGTIMEEARSTKVDHTLDAAKPLVAVFGEDPIAVTDAKDNLVGGLSLPAA